MCIINVYVLGIRTNAACSWEETAAVSAACAYHYSYSYGCVQTALKRINPKNNRACSSKVFLLSKFKETVNRLNLVHKMSY